MPLTPEIPLYNVVVHFRDDTFPTLNDDTGPRPLADAVAAAALYTARATIAGQHYTVEPAAGTGPRYRLALVSLGGERLLESSWDPCCDRRGNDGIIGSTWADVARAYHAAVGGDARRGTDLTDLTDQLVYRVVRV